MIVKLIQRTSLEGKERNKGRREREEGLLKGRKVFVRKLRMSVSRDDCKVSDGSSNCTVLKLGLHEMKQRRSLYVL